MPDTLTDTMPPPPAPARVRGRGPTPRARRWPALAGAALVTALVPAGAALAASFPEGVTAGPSSFAAATGQRAVQTTGGLFGLEAKSADRAGVKAQGALFGVAAVAGGVGVAAVGGRRGVEASSPKGIAVDATSTDNSAVRANSTKGFGVLAFSQESHAMVGTATLGSAFVGNSAQKYGAELGGGKAPVLLVPASAAGRPQAASGAHAKGELYVDANGDLFLCTASGTPGTWVKVAVTPAP